MLILGLAIAHLLLFISFSLQPAPFWILFPLSLLILSSIALFSEKLRVEHNNSKMVLIGMVTGVFLYSLFGLGNWLIHWTELPVKDSINELYLLVQPIAVWHYLLLFIVVIPGEELFWRGYVLKRIEKKLPRNLAIIISAVLYASAHIYAGAILLLIAAIIAGIMWGWLYLKTNNIWCCIISHLVFDLLLLVLFPLL